jgi:gentisate 1,2-dioxygenase
MTSRGSEATMNIRDTTGSERIDFEAAHDLPALYGMLDKVGMKNGWAKAKPSLYPQPQQEFLPAHWRYFDAHDALHAAGRLVGTEWAERRNLIMANPLPGNDYATVRTLVGAYQMVKAGEKARSHRHTPNAMRVVLDAGPNTFTIVDGVMVPMLPGDVLLTPNGCYHGHTNESDQDAYWVDFLDAPLVQLLGPMFFEVHPDEIEVATRVEPESRMRFAYAEYRQRLMASPESAPGLRCLTLGPATLRTFDRVAIHLDAGTNWLSIKDTANSIFVVINGNGTSRIGERTFEWERGDMLAAPSWYDQVHRAESDATLLRVSDLPLMKMLDWFRSGAPV